MSKLINCQTKGINVMESKSLNVFIFLTIMALPACSSGGNYSDQQTLTHAQMVNAGSSCNEIAANIEHMDRIIIENGGQPTNYGHAASQTLNTGLAASGLLRKVPLLGSVTNTAGSWGNQSGNYVERQQLYGAQREKQRLISLFQQKQCRLVG